MKLQSRKLHTGSDPFLLDLRGCSFVPGSGGFTPAKLITSPVLLRGLGGGGGLRRGSVGLSEDTGRTGLLLVGGVIGLGTRLGGEGEGDGGRGRDLCFNGGDLAFGAVFGRDLFVEKDLDLDCEKNKMYNHVY